MAVLEKLNIGIVGAVGRGADFRASFDGSVTENGRPESRRYSYVNNRRGRRDTDAVLERQAQRAKQVASYLIYLERYGQSGR